MNLVIDIGNTRIKYGLFDSKSLIKSGVLNSEEDLNLLLERHNGPCLISSVNTEIEIKGDYLFLAHDLPLPIDLKLYKTPETLGLDRIAALAGARELSDTASLIIDIGTCITIDLLSEEGEFLGGNISPGPELRFKSMYNFTSSLPLEQLKENSVELGRSTAEALQAGVEQGIIHEIEGCFNHQKEKYPDLKLILTGGLTSFFDSKIKEAIFAKPNLVLIGLNSILNYNVKN